MRLISLELSGFDRIALGNTKYFKLTPSLDLQLIIGTNGSGKSSIINECSPLPPNKQDFSKGGFAVKVFEDKGNIYELKSVFDTKQEHYFIKNGENLNIGRTVSVQKELVKQEFGITPEIHELIMGREKFSTMAPAQRRYWLTQLSSVSYDYAIGVYNKLREKLRDTTGALKITKNRLVVESTKTLSEQEQDLIKREVNELHEFLSHIVEYRKPIEGNIDSINNDINRFNSETIRVSKELIYIINKTKEHNHYGNIDNVNQMIGVFTAKENVAKTFINELHEKINKITENINILMKTGNQGIEQLDKRIQDLKEQQTFLLMNKTVLKDVHRTPLEAIRAIEICKSTLDSVFTQMPSNSDLRYSTGTKNKTIESIGKNTNRIEYLKAEIAKLNNKKEHLLEHKNKSNLTCPNCKATINFVFSQLDYENTVNLIDKYAIELNILNKELEVLQEQLNDINKYIEIYNQYRLIKNSYPALEQLWVLIDNTIVNTPTRCINIVESFHSDVLADKAYIELEKEITDLTQLITAKKLIGDQDCDKLKDERDKIEQDIYKYQLDVILAKQELSILNQYKNYLITIDKLNSDLNFNHTSLKTAIDTKAENLKRQAVIEGIRYVQSVLSKKENSLLELNNQLNIIKDLEKSISILEEDELCLKTLVSELSPIDGLIAEGLFGFIKIFVNQMNAFIKTVWSYEMIIQTCQLSEDSKVDLDYKFPIKIEGKPKLTPDVSMGSTSMMEIIDLAFKIVAIKHLGLNDIPLFLDEFGTGFDKAHRLAVYSVFDYLMNQIQFNQVFIVNHYSDLYGSFKNAEICVLHDSNVDIPKGAIYNKHVVIT